MIGQKWRAADTNHKSSIVNHKWIGSAFGSATVAAMLPLCQHGYEALLERELTAIGLAVTEKGPGWALAADGDATGLVFPSLTLIAPREFKGESVNALAQQLADFFLESLRGERI